MWLVFSSISEIYYWDDMTSFREVFKTPFKDSDENVKLVGSVAHLPLWETV